MAMEIKIEEITEFYFRSFVHFNSLDEAKLFIESDEKNKLTEAASAAFKKKEHEGYKVLKPVFLDEIILDEDSLCVFRIFRAEMTKAF